jgi:Nucleolar protein 12 (25kDa)
MTKRNNSNHAKSKSSPKKAKSKRGGNEKTDTVTNLNKSGRPPKRVESVVFDAAARRAHLASASTRKQERRAYGLAMQKVKNRAALLANRAALRQAKAERIATAEQAAATMAATTAAANEQTFLGIETAAPNDETDLDSGFADQQEEDVVVDEENATFHQPPLEQAATATTTADTTVVVHYQGDETHSQWGGSVVVTTCTHIPDSDNEHDDNDVDNDQNAPVKKRDVQQEYAGRVEKYLKQLKGHLPGKKKSTTTSSSNKRGGTHGAVGMKGVGSAATLKVAQKVLARTTPKKVVPVKKGGKSGRHGKKR